MLTTEKEGDGGDKAKRMSLLSESLDFDEEEALDMIEKYHNENLQLFKENEKLKSENIQLTSRNLKTEQELEKAQAEIKQAEVELQNEKFLRVEAQSKHAALNQRINEMERLRGADQIEIDNLMHKLELLQK